MNKKIALCLYGTSPFDKSGQKIDSYRSLNSWKQNFNKEGMDVYLHTWCNDDADGNKKNELLNVFNPVKYCIEKQIDFGDFKLYDIRQKSRNYSMKECVNMIEKEYNLVILSRIDLVWFVKIDFTTCDENRFTIGEWTTPHHFYNGIDGILDWYYVSNYNNIKKFVNDLYNDHDTLIKESLGDAHILHSYYLSKVGFDKIIDLKYKSRQEVEVEYKC